MRKWLAIALGAVGVFIVGSMLGWWITREGIGEWFGGFAALAIFLSWAVWPRA